MTASGVIRAQEIPAHGVRADFAGGGLSSDLGPVLLRGADLQIGLTKRIAAAARPISKALVEQFIGTLPPRQPVGRRPHRPSWNNYTPCRMPTWLL